jgi:hypothetical protein
LFVENQFRRSGVADGNICRTVTVEITNDQVTLGIAFP